MEEELKRYSFLQKNKMCESGSKKRNIFMQIWIIIWK